MEDIFTHVTPWENFLSILKNGYLIPNKCHLFKEDLLYMGYNRLAHKPSKKDYNWNENSPVVIYFDSRIYSQSFRFYPFDTGAILAGRFSFTDLTNVRVMDSLSFSSKIYTPKQWIKSIYSTPSNYINYCRPDLLNDITYVNNILNEAYNMLECKTNKLDYRLTSIECHFKKPISLLSATTIVLPIDKKDEFLKLKNESTCRFLYYFDKSKNGYLPEDLTSISVNIFMN